MEENVITYEQKMAKVMLELRKLRPFYSALYESMEKVESTVIETMGVSTNKLYYNREFIEKTNLSDLIFINLHEICHVALMHVVRRESRDPYLWNVACDLYVNAAIIDEFDLNNIGSQASSLTKITIPSDGLFCSSIDIEKDYVEAIYESLYSQANRNGYNDSIGGTFEFTYQGSLGESLGTRMPGYNTVVIEINKDNFENDLIDTGEDISTKEQESRKIVTDAMVRSEIQSKSWGNVSSMVESLVKEYLKSRVNWKRLLKKYLIQATSKDSSFMKPDKRMYYQRAIYPGQCSEGEYSISGIKVCLDASGSISTDDMSAFYYQVRDLADKFNISAEVIFWDTEAVRVGYMQDFKEFERMRCYSGGGTDPASVFETLSNDKIKPTVTLVFTDGYFNISHLSKYKKKFRDTIWIMSKNCQKDFRPPFGKVAYAEFD